MCLLVLSSRLDRQQTRLPFKTFQLQCILPMVVLYICVLFHMIRRRHTKVNNATQLANRRPPIPTLVLRPPLFAEAEAVDPVAVADGPGPAVTMSPFPPGYV
jgi:hypothetical protein